MGFWNAVKNSARNFKRDIKENGVKYLIFGTAIGAGAYFAYDRGLLGKKVEVELPDGYEIRRIEAGNDDEVTIDEEDVPFED